MNSTIPTIRPRLGHWATTVTAIAGVSTASAASVIQTATSLFVPSFRGSTGSVHFGWENGTWDGNPPLTPGGLDVTPDLINSTPSLNPGSGGLLTQGVAGDIVSGSNNIYATISAVNHLGLRLTIPTLGLPGAGGFTTIIAQGLGLSGAQFGFAGAMDGFGFGTINGISPTYAIGNNALGRSQWWAKWEIPGNEASYTVDVVGALGSPNGSFVSVTDMQVDSWFSPTGFGPDTAVVPEPSSLSLAALGGALLVRRRRPQHGMHSPQTNQQP